MAAARVVGAVGGDGADRLAFGDLAEQVRQHGTITVAAGGEFDGADVRRGRVHGQMHLAPLASSLRAMLARLPFAIAEELDASAVDQQVQWPIGTSIRNLDGQDLLPPAQRREVRHGPVQTRQPEQAGHHSGGLAQRELEENLDRQAELNGGIGEDRWASRPPITLCAPGHVLVHPDQQRAALAQRRVIAGPVRRAVAGGRWLAHAARVTAWIREVDPLSSEMCNNAYQLDWIKQEAGDLPFARVKLRHVEALMAKKAGPSAANGVKKNLSMLYNFAAKKLDYLGPNPAKFAERLKENSDGYHTWTNGEVDRFLERHGPGTKARLAILIALNTGMARQDLCHSGRHMISVKGDQLRIAYARGKPR